MGFKALIQKGRKFVANNSPSILTAITVGGSLGTTLLSIDATIKAVERVKEKKITDKKEIVKECWKLYIPTAISLGLTIASAILSNRAASKKMKILAAAYSLSEAALNEWKSTTKEMVGDKKFQEVKEQVAVNKMKKMEKSETKNTDAPIIVGDGKIPCSDAFPGRCFMTKTPNIERAVNDLNKRMIQEMYISLNELYYEIGLPPVKQGDRLGWNLSREGLIEITYGSTLNEEGIPCLVLDYQVEPGFGFDKLM